MKDQFLEILENHKGILYKVGRSFTDNEQDFEDLYQEMLIQIWKSMDRFEGKAKISTFLYRLALNTALTFQKKAERRKNHLVDTVKMVLNSRSAPAQMEVLSEKVKLLYQSIFELPDDQKVIILLYLEEKSYQEIAEIMGVTTSLVGVKINRAKKKLYQLLSEKGYGRL